MEFSGGDPLAIASTDALLSLTVYGLYVGPDIVSPSRAPADPCDIRECCNADTQSKLVWASISDTAPEMTARNRYMLGQLKPLA